MQSNPGKDDNPFNNNDGPSGMNNKASDKGAASGFVRTSKLAK